MDSQIASVVGLELTVYGKGLGGVTITLTVNISTVNTVHTITTARRGVFRRDTVASIFTEQGRCTCQLLTRSGIHSQCASLFVGNDKGLALVVVGLHDVLNRCRFSRRCGVSFGWDSKRRTCGNG